MNRRSIVGLLIVPVILMGTHFSQAQDKASPTTVAEPKGLIPEDGCWTLRVDETLNGSLDGDVQTLKLQLRCRNNRLTGHYLDSPNKSVFAGELIRGKTVLIVLRQDSPGYTGVWVGQQVGENRFKGTWHSNGIGSAGDFELVLDTATKPK
jgi:hypothetical protein